MVRGSLPLVLALALTGCDWPAPPRQDAAEGIRQALTGPCTPAEVERLLDWLTLVRMAASGERSAGREPAAGTPATERMPDLRPRCQEAFEAWAPGGLP